ncbi:DUF1631 family protein [Herbaspirillum sp. SJZ107]|uniref:DUF1631 family protein n=1 Tax=Herbaspirillum sp. SJZ107 TaxID=2572881 RepID=UPI00114E39C0|nr:DUF1631 family protein [Herbaspirillum sp. SJZ107]TQK03317.1 uncharacterized protein DUF1631 [Herbaspirillum sp. SJZ107]
MTASQAQTPAARKAASLQATLDALAGAVSTHVKDALGDMAARMSAALAEVDAPGLDTRAVYQRVKSARLLKDNGYAFVHLAEAAIGQAVRAELDALGPAAHARQPAAAAAVALSLVPLEEIDDKLAFTALARPFDIQHADVLATLSVRLGLLLERGLLRADANPFRPAVFLKALDQAWREFEPDAEAHGLIQPLLRPEIVFDLAPLLERLVEVLKRKEGQPGSVDALRIQKTDDSAAARAARAGSRAALAKQLRALFGDDGGEDGVPLIPDLPAMPSGDGGWRPSAAAGFQGGAGADPAGGAAPAAVTASAGAAAPPLQPAAGFAPAAGSPVFQPLQGGVAGGGGTPLQPGAGIVPGPLPVQPVQPVQSAAGAPTHAALPAQGVAAGQAAFHVQVQTAAGSAGAAVGAVGTGAGAMPGLALQWAGIPVQGLVAAASGAAPLPQAAPGAAMVASAPLLELVAGIEPVLAAARANGGGQGGAAAPHQVFYLPRLKQSLPQGSLSRGDANTLDLLSRVFETVLLDDSIPPRARELLQLLQVPVLKAALLDKSFFFEEAHPARRMVDLLSRMGWEQHKDGDDPVFQAMQRSVDRVAQPGGGAGAGFEEAVAGLEASIAQEERAEEQALATPVATALKQEKLAAATRAARDAVALRIGAGKDQDADGADAGEILDAVSGFLEQRWTTVLTFAYTIEDDKPGAVGNATRAMDDLIWSIKPKATQEQRKTLIARLPRLLATLNKWLDAIRWHDAERLHFFARLAEYHAAIVRAPIELSPERQLELAVEAAQRDAMRRVELENAAAAQEAARQDAISPLDGLERGMWCEFRSDDGARTNARKVRLAWVSPLRTLFIFSGSGRREAFSMTAEKLVDALHAGAARVLAMEGVVGQVLMAAMGDGPGSHAPDRAIPKFH